MFNCLPPMSLRCLNAIVPSNRQSLAVKQEINVQVRNQSVNHDIFNLLVMKIIAQQIIFRKPISYINTSGYFGKYFNKELTFRHFTSNIIRVSVYMKIFGLNNLHDYKNRDETRRE